MIASAGVLVGIRATVDLNLHDGGRPTDPAKVDGLLYMDELASMLNNPICIFDVSGQLDAFVKFFITVGFSPFDFSFDITIVEVTLLNMQDITDPICNHPPPPHLAQERRRVGNADPEDRPEHARPQHGRRRRSGASCRTARRSSSASSTTTRRRPQVLRDGLRADAGVPGGRPPADQADLRRRRREEGQHHDAARRRLDERDGRLNRLAADRRLRAGRDLRRRRQGRHPGRLPPTTCCR